MRNHDLAVAAIATALTSAVALAERLFNDPRTLGFRAKLTF